MTKITARVLRVFGLSLAVATALPGAVRADVTVEQRTTLSVASLINAHGGSTTSIAADKKREDSETHCEGVMSIVCGNLRSGDIVRLDRNLTWQLEPAKKRYREQTFASPAELAAMRARMQAHLEKMQSCPVSKKQEPVDKSQCEMSPPKIDVHKTNDQASIAGHSAQRTLATLTETCTNKSTGEVCDTVVAVDLWLTQDKVPGMSDRRAFDQAYAKKLGLEESAGVLGGQMAKYLAPYQSQIKELTAKSGELKGLPLKTTLRVMSGGPQCKSLNSDTGAGGAAGAANPLDNMSQAGKAMGNLVGGLFHKKKAADADAAPAGDGTASGGTASASGAAAGNVSSTAVPSGPDPYAAFHKLLTFTSETVNISADPVAADRFEVPPDWTKEAPRPVNTKDEDDECPKT